MKYRNFCGEQVSVLGFGGMRFPMNSEGKIDEPTSEKMLMHAYENGVNYYDTAYFYHDGESETFLGKALNKIRKDIFIATKSPVYAFKNEDDFERYFQNQLDRLQTDYVDFYLLHALNKDTWENSVLKFDLLTKLKKLKEEGRVRHIGFSFHDNLDMFKEIVDSFDEWEFCQIQYNYIDLENQAGREGLLYARQKGLDIIIMEPLLGGKLVDPPAMVKKALPSARKPIEYALDFLWSHSEISLILSGMSSMEQVKDNLIYAKHSRVGKLTETDIKKILEARKVYLTNALVPCTKCLYCMPCPFGLDIPAIYDAYNGTVSKGMEQSREEYQKIAHRADECQKCGACLVRCPQAIKPNDFMDKIAEVFSA